MITGRQWGAIRHAEKRGRQALALVEHQAALEAQYPYLGELRRLEERGAWYAATWRRHGELVFQREVCGWLPVAEITAEGFYVEK